MSFGFGGAQARSGGGAQASQGQDLEQIDTEQLSFHAISGDDQLRLLPTPWPSEGLPPPHASLLSVASSRGLVAAVGPYTLVIAKTDSVRKAFAEKKAGGKTVPFTPEATISVPRVSQVAFSSNEACLVVVAEQGGGLAVYDTASITSGVKDPAFQVGTNGVGVRQLLPNPNPSSDWSHLFGIVLETGQLLLADLKARELVKNSSGNPVFHENVVSACWSRLGKQIVAGRNDGTAAQIDPQGNVKAEIPLPPRLPELSGSSASQMALMSIYWLDTNDFLLVHTPTTAPSGDGMTDDMPSDSIFHLARRENPKSNDWTFQTIIDPAPGMPMGGRAPAHHFIQRLKDWPPNLDELLLSISTSSTDVGMLTKASAPLNSQTPVIGTLATTNPPDTHRAGMPLSEADGISDTSPIGMAIDMSSNALIQKPIPTDSEVAESPVPLPALYILNNEGILRIWYIVYNASIRAKLPFPDLIAAGGPRSLEQKKDTPSTAPPPASPFGASMPPPSKQATPSSQPANQPTFGAPSTPAFGGSTGLGSKASPWGAPPPATTGGGMGAPASPVPKASPAFGSSTPLAGASGFGQVGGIGQKVSPWGATAPAQQQQKSVFGGQPSAQPFGGNAAAQSPFAKFGTGEQKGASGASSVFGAGQAGSTFGGVGAAAQQKGPSASPFAAFGQQKPATTGVSGEPSFGSTATMGTRSSFGAGSTIGGTSLFGTPSQNGSMSFGRPSAPTSREETMMGEEEAGAAAKSTAEAMKAVGGLFGNGFKLGSTFKGDGSARDDLAKPKGTTGFDFLGGGFKNALDEAGSARGEQPVTPVKKEPGTDEGPRLQDIPAASEATVSTTPASAPAKRDDDPLTYKPKRFAGDVPPVEPSPPDDEEAATKVNEKVKQEDEEAPLAGSPPIDLGNEKFSEAAGSEDGQVPAGPEDEDDSWSEEEGEDDGEGAERDEDDQSADDEDDEEEESDHEVTDPKGLSAFEARLHPASPKRAQHQQPQQPQQQEEEVESTTPATERKPGPLPSFTPAGLPKHNVNFAPPVQESPRSPSPVRAVTGPMQQKPSFGAFSKPSLVQHPSQTKPSLVQHPSQTSSASTLGKPSKAAQNTPQRIVVAPSKPATERSASGLSPAEPPPPADGELEDEEDARVRNLLESQPEPTLEVPSFLAHQDYVGLSAKEGLGGQIERVFRDVNSMVDTLGLNGHALKGFVDGQEELREVDGGRDVEGLEDERGWTLDEGSELARLMEVDIGARLDAWRLDDVAGMLGDVQGEEEEVARLKARALELKRRVKAHSDPEHVASQKAAPLSTEAQAQQSELRQSVQRAQKLLGQVEEAMSLLRAELASAATANSRASSAIGGGGVPTLEAVTNTILKMTAMIERKSGDIDVLESHIRHLPGGIAALPKLSEDYEDQLVAGLTGSKLLGASSPRGTPVSSSSRRRMLANGDAPGMSGMLGGSRFRSTPPLSTSSPALRNGKSSLFSPEASRLGRSSVSGTPTRRKMVDVTEAEVKEYCAKAGRRRAVLGALRKGVEGTGVRVVGVER
ncbi:hypothetical protein LTR91_004079 [Friedmanniomyces endolithicus]|uniref:Nucleoporin Nup159/Nup146 N-terminal domain-containing protein n=1 Tax=Friedmanniomyces endolithicus TaxID=329885 RepID=A0AAN6KWL6_9PEZI|nr:hypothetical protein LTR75_011632 [Friedmanniomyces endolithicus]KAK0873040.1 hypothetical protein LTS02_000976 [Friedmanniomyces endolithicus]KAK0916843.1 hypothetical protein LTR02_000614 [Friedmanniomyces endolithicus]KAK1005068.1 hypothetical protein LTS01_003432 [Friedmanniomyces endolithicus]KAK1005223.1 hypothetical protein LTR91_004079 [Friedmanniomyces endolithicus]